MQISPFGLSLSKPFPFLEDEKEGLRQAQPERYVVFPAGP
jgi:hypothetical protein